MSRPRDSELYQLFDRSPIGMYRARRDGRFVYVNLALVRLLAYESIDQLMKTNISDDIYVDRMDRERLITKYWKGQVVDGAQVKWKTRDGRHLIVRLYGHVVDGPDQSFDASVLDVTDLEATNAELRRQREEIERTATTLDMVVRQVSAIWWLCDRDLRLLRTGGAVMELLGYAPETYVGWTIADVLADPDHPAIAAHQRALAGHVSHYTSEYRGKQFDHTIAPHRVDGEIIGVIGTNIDVTTSRALERRMVDAQRAESLGVLAGGLAHDFNNLLVAILGNADLGLRDTVAGAPGFAALENIRNASLRAAELTGQLLAYAGRAGVSSARVLPKPLIDELLTISAPSMPANIAVSVEIPADLAIRGDAAQVRQVFLNLIGNARDALLERGGSITIRARSVTHDGVAHADDVLSAPAGEYAVIEVADDGCGMCSETRRRIFEPFFTTKPTGHGLGLAATLGIVRAHGGGVRLVSSPGTGSSFQVMWPSPLTGTEHAPLAAPTLRTVLVIDDEDLVRDVVARMIEDLGYAAVTACDGVVGLELIESTSIDAVLVDLTMPRMSGADVVAALRQRRPGLPVVLCTGFDRDRKGPIQADAYLPKPFRIEALEETLAKILG